ncbi:Rad17 cell cycle checkpoint protein-domain-containing protein [Dipodascopsis uninucleata]
MPPTRKRRRVESGQTEREVVLGNRNANSRGKKSNVSVHTSRRRSKSGSIAAGLLSSFGPEHSAHLEGITVDDIEDIDDIFLSEEESHSRNSKSTATKKTEIAPHRPAVVDISDNNYLTRANGSFKTGKSDDHRMWTEKYAPITVDSLALHYQKYQRVRNWLSSVLANSLKQKILVLVGPSGCSKTSTIHVIARELDLDITEWVTPQITNTSNDRVSLSQAFEEFVFNAQRFDSANSLKIDGSYAVIDMRGRDMRHKIIVLEDLPAVFASDNVARDRFRNTLNTYLHSRANGSPPLVIIITEVEMREMLDSSGSSFSAETVLGKDILAHPKVGRIDFNPINKTLMSKVLKTIVSKERLILDPNILSNLAELGDVRSAINALEFYSRASDSDRSSQSSNAYNTIGIRETYLDIFHAIGKVVYNKSLKEIESVLESGSTTMLVPGIFENYASSCSSAEVLDNCCEALSDSEILMSSNKGWWKRSSYQSDFGAIDLTELATEVCIRGTMKSLDRPSKRLNISIRDYIERSRRNAKGNTNSNFGIGGGGYSFVKSYDYLIWRQQRYVRETIGKLLRAQAREDLIDPEINYQSTNFSINDKSNINRLNRKVEDYMTEDAFWESLIRKDDSFRKIGGSYGSMEWTEIASSNPENGIRNLGYCHNDQNHCNKKEYTNVFNQNLSQDDDDVNSILISGLVLPDDDISEVED